MTMTSPLGVLEVGTLLSVALYGLITLQVHVYFQGGYQDHLIIRTLVSGIWILDTIHTVFLCIFLYHLTVTNYGRPESINNFHWAYTSVLLLNGILAFAVQVFFAYRIKVLSGRLTITIICWGVSLVRMGMVIMVVIMTVDAKTVSTFFQKYEWTLPTTLSTLSFGDLLNTSALCFILSRRKTGHKRTNRLINTIIIWTIETGLITTICAIAVAILGVTQAQNLTWIGLYFFFPKFYSISMLVSLNRRERVRNEMSEKSVDESTMQFALSRQQEAPVVKMMPVTAGDKWAGEKSAPLEWHA